MSTITDIKVVRVQTRDMMRHFLTLPRTVYARDPCWTPQLHSEVRRSLDAANNPYFSRASVALFVAFRAGAPVARVSAVVNHAYLSHTQRLPALFGYFEAMDDVEAVQVLFRHAIRWCRSLGASTLVGPFHPHHYSELGLQLSGFDDLPSFFQPHHRPYYLPLLRSCGFSVQHRIHTRRNPAIRTFLERADKPTIPSNGLVVRRLRKREMSEDLERIRYVFNDAFEGNPYFLPLTRDEYLYAARSLQYVTRPDLNVIVEHNGEPVGALQCVLDINPLLAPMRRGYALPWDGIRFLRQRDHIRRLIVFAVGIRRAWQRTRVHLLLFRALQEISSSFDELETTWMSPDNPLAIHAAERFGLEPDKEFALLSKPLSQTEL